MHPLRHTRDLTASRWCSSPTGNETAGEEHPLSAGEFVKSSLPLGERVRLKIPPEAGGEGVF